jgi:hypothetical protein
MYRNLIGTARHWRVGGKNRSHGVLSLFKIEDCQHLIRRFNRTGPKGSNFLDGQFRAQALCDQIHCQHRSGAPFPGSTMHGHAHAGFVRSMNRIENRCELPFRRWLHIRHRYMDHHQSGFVHPLPGCGSFRQRDEHFDAVFAQPPEVVGRIRERQCREVGLIDPTERRRWHEILASVMRLCYGRREGPTAEFC